jgi:hypothetical protein
MVGFVRCSLGDKTCERMDSSNKVKGDIHEDRKEGFADSKNVTIKRIVGGKPDTIKVNTKRLEDADGGSFQVLPGDIITVGESWY